MDIVAAQLLNWIQNSKRVVSPHQVLYDPMVSYCFGLDQAGEVGAILGFSHVSCLFGRIMPLYYHIIPIDKYLWLVWPPNICLPTSSGYNDSRRDATTVMGIGLGALFPNCETVEIGEWLQLIHMVGVHPRKKLENDTQMTQASNWAFLCAARCEHHVVVVVVVVTPWFPCDDEWL